MPQRFALLINACVGVLLATSLAQGEEEELTDAEFSNLHTLITPAAGESRWMEIEWYPNIWEARQQAAAEGKPLFLMAGSGGAPSAGC